MTVFVLAGGLGTRLASLAPDLPKALVPVAGRPFVDHLLYALAAQGLGDVVLCAGHLATSLAEHVADGSRFGVRARVVVEDRPRGTAGALAFARRAVAHPEETFLALNGDTWAELDAEALVAHHRALAADATVACYRVDDASARGAVVPGDDGRLVEFAEKARSGPGWVSGGVVVLEPRALDGVGDGETSLERDVLPRLLAAGRTVGAWKAPGRFWDMGTPEGLAETEKALAASGRAGLGAHATGKDPA
jgi:NDP-sugar pyrophosphorylase family protein